MLLGTLQRNLTTEVSCMTYFMEICIEASKTLRASVYLVRAQMGRDGTSLPFVLTFSILIQ